ncbi:MAG TPA: HNH endonuclease signature motif containing protein [Candidatus Bathyarchaeia archaeon]|nr:HNH endonuclease signature motif containing protein [Candidatus Bathyarchaeia archaeon]
MLAAKPFLVEVDEAHIRRERARARELRASQWWKRRCAAGVCHYCGARVGARSLTMDHLVPVIRGGHSTRGNLVAACKACNRAKGHRLATEWQPEAVASEARTDRAPRADGAPRVD